MIHEWEKKKADKKSFKKYVKPCCRGNMLCMLYLTCLGTKDEPMPLIAIGPDWKFSLLEIFLVNMPLMAAAKNNTGMVMYVTVATLAW